MSRARGIASESIHTRVAALLLFWSILTLAILNPLLCLMHCAMIRQHPALSTEQQHFLCDLGDRDAKGWPGAFSAVWSGPRAVHEALPLSPDGLVVIMALVMILLAAPLNIRQHLPLPDRPPPKALPAL